MLIEINRFMTVDEVRAAYGLPEPLAGKILPVLPVAVVLDDGTRLYLESAIDQFLAEFVNRQRITEGRANPPPEKKPGRKDETAVIAAYVNQLLPGKSWREIWRLCQKKWPGNEHVENAERVRGIWRRHYEKNTGLIDSSS